MTKSITAALLAVQKELKPVKKSKENTHFNSSYATIQDVFESILPLLHKNGLLLTQTTVFQGEKFALKTEIIHVETEQKFEGYYWLNPKDPGNPQHLGSALTYAKRYALCSMVGLVVDEDDDGNAGSESKIASESKPQAKATTSKPISPSGGIGTVTFIPAAVSVKHGEKNGKSWSKFGIKTPDGEWIGTFDENLGYLATEAKNGNFPITVGFTISNGYKNVATLVKAEEIEAEPFA